MKTSAKGQIPTFSSKAAELAYNRGEVQIEALIRGKSPNAALTITRNVILDYASRGIWSPIRRIELSLDIGIIHIWQTSLDEVCLNESLKKGDFVIKLLKQLLECRQNRDEKVSSQKLTIEFLFDVALREIIPSDYRIPTNSELWLELLPLFYDQVGHHGNSIPIKYFEDNWRNIDQYRIIDLIDGILTFSGSSSINQGSFVGHLIRHLWRTFHLQSNVFPSQQIQFAQILKPVVQFYRPGSFTQIQHVDMQFVYMRAAKAVEEAVRQAQLIVDLEEEIKTQIVKPNEVIKFNRFTMSDNGDLKDFLFHFYDPNPRSFDLENKKEKVFNRLQEIFLNIKLWSKGKGLNLNDVVFYAHGTLKANGDEVPFDFELAF